MAHGGLDEVGTEEAHQVDPGAVVGALVAVVDAAVAAEGAVGHLVELGDVIEGLGGVGRRGGATEGLDVVLEVVGVGHLAGHQVDVS